jgi:hypothetical protein
MPNAVADIFRRAAECNRNDPRREGNILRIEAGCEMLVTGDLHGDRANYGGILRYADMENHPRRRLVLQEIVHGPPDAQTQHDPSVEILFRAARLRVDHPEGVLFVLGNHDVAQVTGNEITKDGRGTCRDFNDTIKANFGPDADEIRSALEDFLLSIPLAIRTAGGVQISHSLPSPDRMGMAGTEIFSRAYRPDDLRRGNPVYEWTWGRGQTPEQVDALADELGVSFFVVGHFHVEAGVKLVTPRMITLASDGPRGCVMTFDSGETLTADSAMTKIKFIRALAQSE